MNQRLDLTDDDLRCPSCETTEIIGVEIWGQYDGVLYWECPACSHRWHRFPEGHYLHGRAVPYVERGDEPSPERMVVDL